MHIKVYRKSRNTYKPCTLKEAIDNNWILEEEDGLLSTDLRTKIAISSGAYDTHGQPLYVGDVVGYKGDTHFITYNTSSYEFGMICDISKSYIPLKDVKTEEICKSGSILDTSHKNKEWLHLISEGDESGYNEYTFAANYRLEF